MENPKSLAQIGGHPLHPMIVPFPIAFYFGTLITDLVFASSGDTFWARMAFWLLTAGVASSALAGTVGAIDFIGDRSIRVIRDSWWHAGGNALASLISIADLYLRYLVGSAEGSSKYLWMAGLVALLLVFTSWKGGNLVFKHRVGVAD